MGKLPSILRLVAYEVKPKCQTDTEEESISTQCNSVANKKMDTKKEKRLDQVHVFFHYGNECLKLNKAKIKDSKRLPKRFYNHIELLIKIVSIQRTETGDNSTERMETGDRNMR
ncbi:hypothetical protein CHS0354_041022, partial [Potamilus streckersoni]